jgi:hypothetical protein
MPIELVFETHSTTEDNERGVVTGWGAGKLSAAGRAQARQMGQRRANDGVEAIFTSDLARAIESVRMAFPDSPIPVFMDWRLRECDYGEMTGIDPDKLERTEHIDAPYPAGESWRQAVERVGWSSVTSGPGGTGRVSSSSDMSRRGGAWNTRSTGPLWSRSLRRRSSGRRDGSTAWTSARALLAEHLRQRGALLGRGRGGDRRFELLTMVLGPSSILVAARVDLDDFVDGVGAEQVAEDIDAQVRKAVPSVSQFFPDPTSPSKAQHERGAVREC